jgi:four helix bundle protein
MDEIVGNVIEEPYEEYKSYKDFTTLVCWKDAREVKLFFYDTILKLLPVEEKYNLNNQIRRASVSATANIAEGYGRFHYQEGIQFYRISRGSIYELKDHLISCYDFKYINQEVYTKGIDLIEKAKVSLSGFIKYIQNQKQNKQ